MGRAPRLPTGANSPMVPSILGEREPAAPRMKRLTSYLSRIFLVDAMILFGVVCFLLWLVSCLRSFDVISVKGQGIWTLGYQGLLSMPPLAISFFYICIGIGLVRALQALKGNQELNIIHSSGGLPGLWRAAGVVIAAGVVGVLLLSNFIEPYANRRASILSASVAADLVSSTLKPQRFTQVTPGVVLLIGGRSGNGEIQEFFADDRRDPETRRTYIAETAQLSTDGEEYVVELRNGSLQNHDASGRFSEITFERYDLNVERLSQATGESNPIWEQDSITLVRTAMATGWTSDIVRRLADRNAEGLRVIGICLLVLAMSAFPSGRRAKVGVPLEAFVLLIAFGERGISTYSPMGSATGALAMIVIGTAVLLWRVRPRRTWPMVTA